MIRNLGPISVETKGPNTLVESDGQFGGPAER